jgi:hypothetical protein
MLRLILLLIAAFMICAPAMAASGEPKPVMRTMTITPPPEAAPAKDETSEEAEDEDDDDGSAQPAKSEHIAAPKQDGKALPYYPPINQLTPWPYLKGLYLPAGTSEYRASMAAIAQAPGEAPPIAMLQAASVLLEEGRLADAAFFHQAALLRAAFDDRRFPDAKDKQAALNSIASSAAELNEPVYAYLLQSPETLMQLMTKVVEWDRRTRYAYDPGFKISADFKPKGWYKMHESVQREFLGRWAETGATLWPARQDEIDKNLSKILDK